MDHKREQSSTTNHNQALSITTNHHQALIDLRPLQPAAVVHVYALPLGVNVQGRLAGLPVAVAGAPGPSEGELYLRSYGPGVHVDDADLQVPHSGEGLVYIRSIYGGYQAVGDIVVDHDRLFQVIDAQ